MKKIWQKSSTIKTNPLLESYLISKGGYDDLLIPYDIVASKAHSKMLFKIGILTKKENNDLQMGLDEILALYANGKFKVTAEDEDCHSAIEKFLTKKYGVAGKKIHTGRSRNDQVLVATRLMMKQKLGTLSKLTTKVAAEFLKSAKKYQDLPFPGYSHSQQAMLSSLGHYFSSFTESLLDDRMMQRMACKLIDQNPLGSAAGFGVSIPLDRSFTTKEIGFERVQQNSLYCQASRGKFESFVLESLVQTMLTLGRFAQDMIIFTTQEFNYFEVAEKMTTGSSIMPQKKNLDYMEVLRGYLSVIISHHQQIQNLAKSQLSGYNKDLKFVKGPLLDGFDIVSSSLMVVQEMLLNIKPKQDVIEAKLSQGIFAADIANELVKNGTPFRDAYRQAMADLKSKDIDLTKNIRSKVSLGAPGNLNLEDYSRRISE